MVSIRERVLDLQSIKQRHSRYCTDILLVSSHTYLLVQYLSMETTLTLRVRVYEAWRVSLESCSPLPFTLHLAFVPFRIFRPFLIPFIFHYDSQK